MKMLRREFLKYSGMGVGSVLAGCSDSTGPESGLMHDESRYGTLDLPVQHLAPRTAIAQTTPPLIIHGVDIATEGGTTAVRVGGTTIQATGHSSSLAIGTLPALPAGTHQITIEPPGSFSIDGGSIIIVGPSVDARAVTWILAQQTSATTKGATDEMRSKVDTTIFEVIESTTRSEIDQIRDEGIAEIAALTALFNAQVELEAATVLDVLASMPGGEVFRDTAKAIRKSRKKTIKTFGAAAENELQKITAKLIKATPKS